MQVKKILEVALEKRALVAGATGAGLILGAGIAAATPPTYKGTARVFVSAENRASTTEMLQGSSFARQRVTSYANIIRSPKVLGPVKERQDLAGLTQGLAGRTTAKTPAGTVLIEVSVSAGDPSAAAVLTNAVAESFAKSVAELERPNGAETSPVKLTLVQPASVPTAAVSPKWAVNLGLGGFLGLGAGIGLAVMGRYMNSRIRTVGDVQRLSEVPIIGTIHLDKNSTDNELVVRDRPRSPRAESYRHLRTNVRFVGAPGSGRLFLFTSSIPGEGKTTTTTNLAVTLAESGRSVCLVDADLRKPRVAQYLGLVNDAGLTNVLAGETEASQVFQAWSDEKLQILPAGPTPPNPSELLGSDKMERLLAELVDNFDVVIVDAPPLLPVTDASVLAAACGGAILVVGCDRVHSGDVGRSLTQLENVGVPTLGIVVNRLDAKKGKSYGYGYGYGYGSGEVAYGDKVDPPTAAGSWTGQSSDSGKNYSTKTVLPEASTANSLDKIAIGKHSTATNQK